jgi:hypothetical protein
MYHKVDALMFNSGRGHMGSINKLIDDVIRGSTILACEVGVMVQYNALLEIADYNKLRMESRGFSPLLIFFECMVQDRRIPF